MTKIILNDLELVIFNKDNKDHLNFLKLIINDKTILARFQGIANNLLHNHGDEFFDRSFLVSTKENKLIGFINIGNFNTDEKCVYLRYAININYRGMGYGKKILDGITKYIFNSYPMVETIRLKIASDNKASLGIANASGYKWYKDDFYFAYNPNLSEEYKPIFR